MIFKDLVQVCTKAVAGGVAPETPVLALVPGRRSALNVMRVIGNEVPEVIIEIEAPPPRPKKPKYHPSQTSMFDLWEDGPDNVNAAMDEATQIQCQTV